MGVEFAVCVALAFYLLVGVCFAFAFVFGTADTVVQTGFGLWALVPAPQLGVQLCVPSHPLSVSR